MRLKLIILLTLAMIIPASVWGADEKQTYQDASMPDNKRLLGDDLGATVGFKIWHTNIEFIDGDEASSFIYGPSINVTYKNKFYAGMNYYTGGGFDYDSKDVGTSEGYVISNVEGEASKTDFDLWGGYYFHPRASVFLGYKYSKLENDQSGTLDYYGDDFYISAGADATLKGPVIGINGNYPIKESSFVLSGTLGYGFLNYDQEATIRVNNTEDDGVKDDESGDLLGFSLEFGVSYFFPKLPQVSLTGGYKYQRYENEDNNELTFSGLTFGANYRF